VIVTVKVKQRYVIHGYEGVKSSKSLVEHHQDTIERRSAVMKEETGSILQNRPYRKSCTNSLGNIPFFKHGPVNPLE